MKKFQFHVDLQKIDESRRLITGVATSETPDSSYEIMDYEASKPHFIKWSQTIFEKSGGKSYGNLRSMHSNIAAGKIRDIQFDDLNKLIIVTSEVVDDQEWKKVLKGVYTGYSIGGTYGKTWADGPYRRYEAIPSEISLADYPQNPDSVITLVKADGVSIPLEKYNQENSEDLGTKDTENLSLQKHLGPGNHPSGSPQSVHGGEEDDFDESDEDFDEPTLKDDFDEPTSGDDFEEMMLSYFDDPTDEGPNLQGDVISYEEGGYLTNDRGVVYRNPETNTEFQFTVRETTSSRGTISPRDVENELLHFLKEGKWSKGLKIRSSREAGYLTNDPGIEIQYPDGSRYVIDIIER
jgi:hypothetical protein